MDIRVYGNPTEEELCALVCALMARRRAQPPPAPEVRKAGWTPVWSPYWSPRSWAGPASRAR
ncbi:acyl-CoA carboxylase subunit epsilon [Thermoactinospora rubra]|uniref:acyl-CoA carboxylase subunit epsilon n=1 Tax=Thermoactinospora rubra TaxID=1088767 RepID=UPI00117DE9D6